MIAANGPDVQQEYSSCCFNEGTGDRTTWQTMSHGVLLTRFLFMFLCFLALGDRNLRVPTNRARKVHRPSRMADPLKAGRVQEFCCMNCCTGSVTPCKHATATCKKLISAASMQEPVATSPCMLYKLLHRRCDSLQACNSRS